MKNKNHANESLGQKRSKYYKSVEKKYLQQGDSIDNRGSNLKGHYRA